METTTLDDFMSWNDQLAAAIEAGVPLDLGFDQDNGGAVATLERVNALVARRTSQGATLADSINDQDPAIPSAYRSLMQLSLKSGTPVTGLELSNRLAQKVNQSWDVGRLALCYPTIVICFAFLGIVGFCLYFVPVLQSTYQNLGVKSGPGMRVLESLRATLPYWATTFLLGLVVAVNWVNRASKLQYQHRRERLLEWIPGISRALFQERLANFAGTMTKLLESGASWPDALQVAGAASGDPALMDAARALNSLHNKTVASTVTDGNLRLPPFLRWALLDSEDTTGRLSALKAAADVYRQAASRRQERLKIIVPLLLAVVVGGAATLLYGLALFVPVVEMLRGIATQYAG